VTDYEDNDVEVYCILLLLYGCQTWSLTLKEERLLWVFGNRVLGRILGPERNEASGEWRRLHNKSLMISTVHQMLLW